MTDQGDLNFRIAELERKLANAVLIGTVFERDGNKIRIKDGGLETGLVRWTAVAAGDDRTWRAPSIGEQVVFVCPGGDPEKAVALGRLYQDAHPAPSSDPNMVTAVMADGLVLEHDKDKKWTRISALDSEGTIEIEAKNLVLRIGEKGVLMEDLFGLVSITRHLDGANYETDSYGSNANIVALPQKPLHQPLLPTDEVIEE